jgi:hypothetical protein
MSTGNRPIFTGENALFWPHHAPDPSQSVEDPRDGLGLFGPFDPAQTYGIWYGVIGTKTGIRRFRDWVEKIQHPVVEKEPTRLRPPFPGFEAAFGIPFSPDPLIEVEFQEADLNKHVHIGDRFKRAYEIIGAARPDPGCSRKHACTLGIPKQSRETDTATGQTAIGDCVESQLGHLL